MPLALLGPHAKPWGPEAEALPSLSPQRESAAPGVEPPVHTGERHFHLRFSSSQREDTIKARRIKQAATRDEGEMARRAVGKKMLGLAGGTADAAGRAEVLRGEVRGVGLAGGQMGGKARLRALDLF